MQIDAWLWLFPVMFMLHEFEEIIFLPTWLNRYKRYIKTRYPFTINMVTTLSKLSSAAFAIAVCEEFIILSALTFWCVIEQNYSLFAAIVVVYVLHVIIHLMQSIALGKYIPAVGTGILTAIYSIYALTILNPLIEWQTVWEILPILAAVFLINLFLVHKLALWLADIFNL